MNFSTPRLIITPFTENHANAFLDFYNKDLVMKFIGNGCFNWTKEQLLFKIQKLFTDELFGIHAIQLAESKEIIGEFSVFKIAEETDKVEIGYIINDQYWNKGYATDLLKGFLTSQQNQNTIKTVIARVDSENKASIHICKSLGFILTDTKVVNDKTQITLEYYFSM
ncbi:GNAT family N-acetyltransferase [Flavobacterium sp. xlx-214]|uniref:GNAT family N-acetyltransferase n=1 Tax=unclassified Flavobacterium TaxID=196869 RepID=UPI0013D339A0|nr:MULTISPECIES: GNAT family N-acetyltransferase [unclassified Flavobacterium]MBA5793575.1 GNAT family N-acetyltransferase [Flavobacterium sp. xlx-221]QMI84505.1 GNAT family N-acetyltransferase [Flavobacterium sp. xlx-214]